MLQIPRSKAEQQSNIATINLLINSMYPHDIYDILIKIAEPTILKVAAWVGIFFYFFFGDVHNEALIALFMLVVFDTILGIMAAKSEGKAFLSKKFSRVIGKIIIYSIGVSSAMFADATTGLPFIQTSIIAFMGVTEFISILENIQRLGYETPKKLLNQLEGFKSQK